MYDFAMKKVKDLDPQLSEIVRLTKLDGVQTHSAVMRDALLQEIPKGRVMLIGDAAHPMALGMCLLSIDSKLLADCLVQCLEKEVAMLCKTL
jgi:2-polyprenyl-6-methoxyphenol hydroxylase-like FAD-dependent oxidoreductase